MDGRSAEAHTPCDRAARKTSCKEFMNRLEARTPTQLTRLLPMVLAGRQWAQAPWPKVRILVGCAHLLVRRRCGTTEAEALEQALKDLAKVVQKMPAISNLLCLWSTKWCSPCVLRRPISRDDLDTRMRCEPGSNRGGVPVG